MFDLDVGCWMWFRYWTCSLCSFCEVVKICEEQDVGIMMIVGDNGVVVDEFCMKGPVFASWCPWSGYWQSHFLCLLCSSKSS